MLNSRLICKQLFIWILSCGFSRKNIQFDKAFMIFITRFIQILSLNYIHLYPEISQEFPQFSRNLDNFKGHFLCLLKNDLVSRLLGRCLEAVNGAPFQWVFASPSSLCFVPRDPRKRRRAHCRLQRHQYYVSLEFFLSSVRRQI